MVLNISLTYQLFSSFDTFRAIRLNWCRLILLLNGHYISTWIKSQNLHLCPYNILSISRPESLLIAYYFPYLNADDRLLFATLRFVEDLFATRSYERLFFRFELCGYCELLSIFELLSINNLFMNEFTPYKKFLLSIDCCFSRLI